MVGLSLCVRPAAKGDLITGQRRALSSQRRPLGIGLGTKPQPGRAPASGLPPLWHKLGGAEWGREDGCSWCLGVHIHESMHTRHQPQPPFIHRCGGLLPSKRQSFIPTLFIPQMALGVRKSIWWRKG